MCTYRCNCEDQQKMEHKRRDAVAERARVESDRDRISLVQENEQDRGESHR